MISKVRKNNCRASPLQFALPTPRNHSIIVTVNNLLARWSSLNYCTSASIVTETRTHVGLAMFTSVASRTAKTRKSVNKHLVSGRERMTVKIFHDQSPRKNVADLGTVILSLPLIQEGLLSVSGERMCTILVNGLED